MKNNPHNLGIVALFGLMLLSITLYSHEEYLLLSIITFIMGFVAGMLFLSNLQDFLETILKEDKKDLEETLFNDL